MPEVQEFLLQRPDIMHSAFYIQKQSLEYPTWHEGIYRGDALTFYDETSRTWITGTVTSWSIPDGSGNAPDMEAHYLVTFSRDGVMYEQPLSSGLKVRIEAPTDAELIALPRWCEGRDFEDGNPLSYDPCFENQVTMYTSSGGQKTWYCEKHKPMWAKDHAQ